MISVIVTIIEKWQTCGPGTCLRCIAIIDSSIFVGSCNDGIFKSTNNGDTWISVNNGFPVYEVPTIVIKGNNVFASPSSGGAGGGGVYLSTDNGVNWTAVNNGLTDLDITSLAVVGANLFAGSFSNGVFLSTDDGANWTAVNNGLTNTYVKSLAVSGTQLYAGTGFWNGGVFLSTNNGANWSLISLGLPAEEVRQLAAKDTSVFVSYFWSGIYYSGNNGLNWLQRNNGLTDTNIQCIKVLGTNIFTGTASDNVFLSSNDGVNWNPFNDNWVGSRNIVDFAKNETYIFAVDGGGNGLWRRGINEIPTIIQEVKKEEENVNVYPNPNNGTFTITHKLTGENYNLEIVDLMGKIVHRQLLEKNNNTTSINMHQLANGIYFVTISSNDAKEQIVKKLVIQK